VINDGLHRHGSVDIGSELTFELPGDKGSK
jgi:hypothetical protein